MSERKVLKVDSPVNDMPPMNNMPPMDMGNGGGGKMGSMDDMPPMGNDMPNDGGDMGSEFDTDFDAGVDASEETEPRKYIQQLTGKLSQSLRNFNNDQPQPDAELSKYVCGMIVKQAIEGLSQEDVDDILEKLKSDEDFEEPSDGAEMDNEEGIGDMGNQPPMPQGQEQRQMPMESVSRRRQIDEIFQDLTDTNSENDISDNNFARQQKSFRKKPFTSPNFR